MYKIDELRTKSREELLQLISELKGKLLALRFESATGQLSESHLPSATKKDIAKIFTVLKEKELGIEREVKENTSKGKVKSKDVKVDVKTDKPVVEEIKTTKEVKPAAKPAAKPTEVVKPAKEEQKGANK